MSLIDNQHIRDLLTDMDDIIARSRQGNSIDGDRIRTGQIQYELMSFFRQNPQLMEHAMQAATLPQPSIILPSPRLNCNIDFTQIPKLLPIYVENLDLSSEVDAITQEAFIPGEDYYRVRVMYQQPGSELDRDITPPMRESVAYFGIESLQGWLTHNDQSPICRHPILGQLSIRQQDITKFTYIGPNPHSHSVGGSNRKRKNKSRTLLKKKYKKSIKR